MIRYGIDALTAIRLSRENLVVSAELQLVAPNRLRSDALSLLYREVQAGHLPQPEGRRILAGIVSMRIRLLGDRMSQGTAWRIAERLGSPDTDHAEYLAVAQLQADALVTLDPELVALAGDTVTLAPFEALLRPRRFS